MFFGWFILIVFLQLTVIKNLNLIVLLAVFAGIRKGELFGLLVGAMVGSVLGLFSSAPFILNLLVCSLVGFLSGLIKAHIYYKENVFMEFMFSLCGLVIFYSAHFILAGTIYTSAYSAILLSALVSPVLFRIIDQ